jgi:hypothetical protein
MTTELETARRALGNTEAAGVTATGPTDIAPTYDDDLNRRRQAAINEVGRLLRPEESIRLSAGQDWRDVPLATHPHKTFVPSPLTPEEQLKASAEVQNEAEAQAS